MSFEYLSSPPHPRTYIAVQTPERASAQEAVPALLLPNGVVYERELDGWSDIGRDAGAGSMTAELAENITRDLRKDAAEYRQLRKMLSPSIMDDTVFGLVRGWQMGSAALVGFSALLRNEKILPIVEGTAPRIARTPRQVVIDINSDEIDNTGVHLDPDSFGEAGFAPLELGKESWSEGEAVFVRARRPATISAFTAEQYRQHYDKRPDRIALVSLAARVKTTYWAGM